MKRHTVCVPEEAVALAAFGVNYGPVGVPILLWQA